MRICMVCLGVGNLGESTFIGGQESSMARLSKALSDRGHEITIITTPHLYSNTHSENTGLEWAEVFSLPVSGSYTSFRYGAEFIVKALRKIKDLSGKIDIIHGHSGYPSLGLVTGIGGKISHIPSIHTIYCPIIPPSGFHPYQLLSNRLLSRLYLSQVATLRSQSIMPIAIGTTKDEN